MVVWWNQTRSRHSELLAAKERLADRLIEIETERARASNEGPSDYVALKVALAHAPHVHPEFARRLSQAGEIETAQKGKGARRYVSLSSFLRAVRKHFG